MILKLQNGKVVNATKKSLKKKKEQDLSLGKQVKYVPAAIPEKDSKISFSSLLNFTTCPSAYNAKANGKKGWVTNLYSRKGIVAHALFGEMMEPASRETAKLNPPPTMEEYSEAQELLGRVERYAILKGGTVLGVELMLTATLANGVEICAKADLVIQHLDGTIEVLDLKTGWNSSDPSEDAQGAIAAAAARQVYGVNEVKFTKYFVVFNDFRSQVYGPADTAKLTDYLGMIKPLMDDARASETPSKCFGPHCVKCPYVMSCNLSKSEQELLAQMSPEHLEEAVGIYGGKKKAAEDALKAIAMSTADGVVKTSTTMYRLKSTPVVSVARRSEVSKEAFIAKMLASDEGRAEILAHLSVELKTCAALASSNGVVLQHSSRKTLEKLNLEDDESVA